MFSQVRHIISDVLARSLRHFDRDTLQEGSICDCEEEVLLTLPQVRHFLLTVADTLLTSSQREGPRSFSMLAYSLSRHSDQSVMCSVSRLSSHLLSRTDIDRARSALSLALSLALRSDTQIELSLARTRHVRDDVLTRSLRHFNRGVTCSLTLAPRSDTSKITCLLSRTRSKYHSLALAGQTY